ncbi:hypothetical protein [Methylobacterium phyllostachyos]|nr:hypothetical protein [Methylobacterium phyllostachyos]
MAAIDHDVDDPGEAIAAANDTRRPAAFMPPVWYRRNGYKPDFAGQAARIAGQLTTKRIDRFVS